MSRSVFGWAYPAGAEHDPRAPWNRPGECDACDGSGEIDGGECPDCNGLGREKTRAEMREEWEEAKADMERGDE